MISSFLTCHQFQGNLCKSVVRFWRAVWQLQTITVVSREWSKKKWSLSYNCAWPEILRAWWIYIDFYVGVQILAQNYCLSSMWPFFVFFQMPHHQSMYSWFSVNIRASEVHFFKKWANGTISKVARLKSAKLLLVYCLWFFLITFGCPFYSS